MVEWERDKVADCVDEGRADAEKEAVRELEAALDNVLLADGVRVGSCVVVPDTVRLWLGNKVSVQTFVLVADRDLLMDFDRLLDFEGETLLLVDNEAAALVDREQVSEVVIVDDDDNCSEGVRVSGFVTVCINELLSDIDKERVIVMFVVADGEGLPFSDREVESHLEIDTELDGDLKEERVGDSVRDGVRLLVTVSLGDTVDDGRLVNV